MTASQRLLVLVARSWLMALWVACGTAGDAPAASTTQAADPHQAERPTTAVTHPHEDAVPPAPAPPTPTPSPEPPPQPAEAAAAATGPPQLVLLHAHELLRSEERQVEQLLSTLGRASVTLERAPAGDRAAALEAWLTEADPTARAQLPLAGARGNARAVLVLRLAPPVENRAQGVAGFGVIAGEPPRERLWARGDLPAGARAGLAALLAEEGQP